MGSGKCKKDNCKKHNNHHKCHRSHCKKHNNSLNRHRKKIPCDLNRCNNHRDNRDDLFNNLPIDDIRRPEILDRDGIQVASYYEASSDTVVAPGELVTFSNIGVRTGHPAIVSLGAGRFLFREGGIVNISASVPSDDTGGALGLAIGRQADNLTLIERSVLYNSGDLGSVTRTGTFEIPQGSIVGIMNASPTEDYTIPSTSPDGVQFYQTLQFEVTKPDEILGFARPVV